jgi:hypothetical protein
VEKQKVNKRKRGTQHATSPELLQAEETKKASPNSTLLSDEAFFDHSVTQPEPGSRFSD